jgi:hypothetical protein
VRRPLTCVIESGRPDSNRRRPAWEAQATATNGVTVGQYWRLPSAWGNADSTILRDLKKLGGGAAIKILPILGYVSALRARARWHLSLEEIARLVAIDPKTAARAQDAFQEMRLLRTRRVLHCGQVITERNIEETLCAPAGSSECFYLPLTLIERHRASVPETS